MTPVGMSHEEPQQLRLTAARPAPWEAGPRRRALSHRQRAQHVTQLRDARSGVAHPRVHEGVTGGLAPAGLPCSSRCRAPARVLDKKEAGHAIA